MKVTNISNLSGKSYTMDLPLTEEEYKLGMERRENGELIQNCFPDLTLWQREFLISGITPDEWNEVFGGDDVE